MNSGPICRFAALFVSIFVALPGISASASTAAAALHLWQEIDYPRVPVPDTPGETMSFKVWSGAPGHGFSFDPGVAELRFLLTYDTLQRHPIPAAIAKPEKFTVRMHLPDGAIIAPKNDEKPSWQGITGGPGVSYSQESVFPWTRNALDEAWIEVRLPGQTYWVEIPYGYTRNPFAPLELKAVRQGPPTLAAAMKDLPKRDRVVPWANVIYDLDAIYHQSLLTAEIGNPYDPQAAITLSGTGDGHDLFPRASRTAMRMGNRKLFGVVGRHVNMHWPDGGTYRRVDAFVFNSNPPEDTAARGWGKATVTIDGHPTEFVVPSSLFCTKHGHAASNNDQTIRPPRDPIFE